MSLDEKDNLKITHERTIMKYAFLAGMLAGAVLLYWGLVLFGVVKW